MNPKLQIRLRPGWREMPNPGGPATYIRKTSLASGHLQFSYANHKPGHLSGASEQILMDVCSRMASKVERGRIVTTQSGSCDFGKFASTVSQGKRPAHF